MSNIPVKENILPVERILPSTEVPRMNIDPRIHLAENDVPEDRPIFTPAPVGGNQLPPMVTDRQLYEGRKYPFYNPTKTEDFFAWGQPWYNQLGNGIVNMGAKAAGTFLQSFATIPNTIESVKNGKLSDLSNIDGFESSIDRWYKNVTINFPNYYTDYELEHPFRSIIPGTVGSANFWGDKIISNLGFTIGAIGGAIAQDAIIAGLTGGIGATPLMAAQVGRASLFLNKLFTGTNRVDKALDLARTLGKTEKQILNIRRLGEAAATTKITNGFRYVAGIYGSARTEAAIESREGYNTIKEELINEYKANNYGDEPPTNVLYEIEKSAIDAMNVRFGINMALLSVSNAIQFDNVFKSFINASSKTSLKSGAVQSVGEAGKIGLKEGSLDTFEKKITKSFAGKLWNGVKPKLPLILSEGVYEEGGQYAAEVGTKDYYTRKYRADKDSWDSLNETINSTTKGLKEQFGSNQGIENMLVGAISALITGGAINVADRIRGTGNKAKTEKLVNLLNRHGLTGILKDKYNNTLESVNIAKKMQEAAAEGNVFKYENLKKDMFFSFVMSRVPAGMHDVTIEQLNMLKDLDREEFEKTFGMDFNAENKQTVTSYVDDLIESANYIKDTTDSINNAFQNPFINRENPKNQEEEKENSYFDVYNDWKTNLIYYATTQKDVNDSLEDINNLLIQTNPLLSTTLVGKLTRGEQLTDLSKQYETEANILSEGVEGLPYEQKKQVKNKIKKLRTLAEEISIANSNGKLTDNLFHTLLNFELNNRDTNLPEVISKDKIDKLIEQSENINKYELKKEQASKQYDLLASKDGFVKFFENEESKPSTPIATPPLEAKKFTFKNNKGADEELSLNREYTNPQIKLARVTKSGEGFKVTSPEGTIKFFDDKEKAKQYADEINTDFAELSSIQIIAFNEDGTVKIRDLAGNIQNIALDRLIGYEKLLTEEEKMAKNKSDIDKEQENILNKSGKDSTGDPTKENEHVEGKLKDVNIYFASSISESETWNDSEFSLPHVKRSREFLNHFKNFKNKNKIHVILATLNNEKELGLEGLTSLSYNGANMSGAVDPDRGFIAQVYVIKEGKKFFFVDEKGNKLTEMNSKADLNKIVFQTMPTTDTHYSVVNNDGKVVEIPRWRQDQKEEFLATIPAWKQKRTEILNSKSTTPYKFTISRGIPIEITTNGLREQNHVGGILVPEEQIKKTKGLVQIPVNGKIVHGGQALTFPKGRPVLQHEDTLQFLQNTKFTPEKAKSVYEVIKAFVKEIQDQSDNNQKIKFNVEFADFLMNVFFYSKEDKGGKNQFVIDTANMNVVIGEKKFPISQIASREAEIIAHLQDVYHNINKNSLKDEVFNNKFTEFVFKNNQLEKVVWDNYQSYLLSAKYPDGSVRSPQSTPLITSVAKPSTEKPYSFMQKYSTLLDFDLPVVQLPKPKPPQQAGDNTLGSFTMDGTTVNTYTLNSGPALFEGEIVDGIVSIRVLDNETIVAATKDPTMTETATNFLSDIPEYKNDLEVLKADNNLLIRTFVANVIKSRLQLEYDNKQKTEEKEQQEAPQIDSTQEGKINTSEIKEDEDDFRRTSIIDEGKGNITEEEIELFKQWAAENIPNIPYEVLENMITTYDNEPAWGVFEDGVIKFYRYAVKGTEYHEAFEGIWKMFLSPEEQQAILNEFRTNRGSFLDRNSNKYILYSEATDGQIKEKLADDFGDYRLGKISAKSLSERIVNFFKRIIEFFKSFGRNDKLKTQLFEAIDTGKFKNAKKVNNDVSPEYSRIPNLTEQQVKEFTEDMVIKTSQFLFGNDKGVVYDIQKITGEDIYNHLKEKYIEQNIYQQLGEKRFGMLFSRVKDFMRTLGVNFTTEGVDINTSDTNYKSYAPEAFTTDWKQTSPFAIKLLLATTPRTKTGGQVAPFTPPKKEISSVKGYTLNSFSRMFSTLINTLSNTNDVAKLEQSFAELIKNDANFINIFHKLGGDVKTGTFPFNKFTYDDWRLFIDFYQVFTKQKPDVFIQYITGDEVFTSAADVYSASRELQREWSKNMKTLATDNSSIIFWNKTTKTFQVRKLDAEIKQVKDNLWEVKNYKGNVSSYDDRKKAKITADKESFPVKTVKDMLTFLNALGINVNMSEYMAMKPYQKTKFIKAVSDIRAYLETKNDIGQITGRVLGVNQSLSVISSLIVNATNPNQDNTHTNVEGTRSQSYDNDNYPSAFENDFNESETLTELLENRPELNDEWSKNSQVLKQNGEFFDENGDSIKSIKISHIEGTKNTDTGKGVSIAKLNLGNRFSQELNQNLEGRYHILIPADSSREWMIEFGHFIKYSEVEKQKHWEKLYQIFRGYLTDDIVLALDANNRSKLKSVGNKAKELRVFKDILSQNKDGKLVPTAILEGIDKLIAEEASLEQIETYVNKNITVIDSLIKSYIEESNERVREILLETGEIVEMQNETFMYKNLSNKFINDERVNKLDKFSLTREELNDILMFANSNYIIANIELHKILFGDPYQFAVKGTKMDEIKRVKSFISPRRKMFNHFMFDNFLNDELNTIEGIELETEDYGYHEFKNYAKTITLSDVTPFSPIYPELFKESDGASFISPGAYREIKMKNRQWSNAAENWYQWQMAYTRQNISGYKYTNNQLEEHDKKLISTPEPQYKTDIIKPIVSGTVFANGQIKLVIDKFSQMPLFYKAIKDTNLEQLFVKMFNEKVDYVVFESGRKVGTEQLHSLYDEDNNFNNEAFREESTIIVPLKIYGIQVETYHEGDVDQTRGSQITKLSSVDLFDNGEPLSEEVKQQYDRSIDMLNKLHQHAYNILLEKLGIEDETFILQNPSIVSKTLEHELLRRGLSENAKLTIRTDENGEFIIPFEASSVYKQIKDILYSIIHKSLVSPTMNGGPKVQAPVTLWENKTQGRGLVQKTKDGWKRITKEEFNSLAQEDRKNVRLIDDTLKFYEDEDGKRYCEVMIPHWFKGMFPKSYTDEQILKYFDTEEGREILTGIGFRIPTQAMASIEVFRVKGFIPQSMGDSVIVPSSIVAKTNSDFDIDKLNTYLKSVYKDENGNISLIKYKGSEEETKAFYRNVYDTTILKNINKIEKYDEFRDKLVNIFQKLEAQYGIERDGVDATFSEEEQDFYDFHRDLLQTIIDQAAEANINPSDYIAEDIERLDSAKEELFTRLLNNKLKNDYANRMYKKALENEYYDALEKMITLPLNFQNLVHPVDDAGLSEYAKYLNGLRGFTEEGIKNKILDRVYMTHTRHDFMMAKKWVGIAAVNIVGHALFQKAQIYINTESIKKLPKKDRDFLKDGIILLPHNTVEVDGKEFASMSRVKTVDGGVISRRLSGYGTAIVDVANDPYIMKIISSDKLVGIFMFLERLGVGDKTKLFLNQPIIQEYIKYLDHINYNYLFKKVNIDLIKSKFPTSPAILKGAVIDVENLAENIKTFHQEKLSATENANQHLILDEFLKYAMMANYSFKMFQAYNYDTTKFRGSESFARKQTKTELARTRNIFSSVDNLLNSSHIGIQSELIDKAMSSMGAILKLEEDRFKSITDNVMIPYKEKEFISNDDFEMIAEKVNAAFLDYIIQTKTGINSRIKELLTGENSVAVRIIQAKEQYPDIQILKELIPVGSDRMEGVQTIKLRVNSTEPYDIDRYSEMMMELKEQLPILYNDIIRVAILQGSSKSPVSIKHIIPVEDYAAVVSPIIKTLTPSPELQAFSNGIFQRNNWRDNDIVPEYKVRFMKNTADPYDEHEPAYETQYGEEVYQYIADKSFPSNTFGKSSERRILLINPDRDTFSAQNDFMKVNRMVLIGKDTAIDFTTGRTIPKSEYVRRKKNNDPSLRDVFGYQKVRLLDGSPLLTSRGEYVYKQVNLWGDGYYASENYIISNSVVGRQSVLDNGTAKVDEISNNDIIAYYSPEDSKRVVEDVLEASEVEEEDLQETPSDNIAKTEQDINEFINEFSEGNFDKLLESFYPIELNIYAVDNDGNINIEHILESYEDLIDFLKETKEFKTTEEIGDNPNDDIRIFGYEPNSYNVVLDDLQWSEFIKLATPEIVRIRPTTFDKTQLEIPFEGNVMSQTKIVSSPKDNETENNQCNPF